MEEFFVKGNRIYKRFDGQAAREKTCGYCHNQRHHGRLSIKLVREHKCIEKQCPFLEKYDHPIWRKKIVDKNNKVNLDDVMEAIHEEREDAFKRGKKQGIEEVLLMIRMVLDESERIGMKEVVERLKHELD